MVTPRYTKAKYTLKSRHLPVGQKREKEGEDGVELARPGNVIPR